MCTRFAHRHRRRATVLVLIVVLLPVLIGMAALTVDVGYMQAVVAEAQNAADAAAFAAASVFADPSWLLATEGQSELVTSRALEYVDRNIFLKPASSVGTIVELGRWDQESASFVALTGDDASSADAVRVAVTRFDMPYFFAAIFGKHRFDATREAVALVTPSCNGIWGLNSVTVPGTVTTDSYDASAGPYSAGSAGTNGDVCSNGDITVAGSADIYGDVLGNTVTLLGASLTISGIVDEVVTILDTPTLDFGDVATNNDNATIGLTDGGIDPIVGDNHLHLDSSDNLTLAPGTYRFKHIKMASSATLTLTGPTTIYLAGNLNMSTNTVINTTQNPTDLTIISSGTDVELSGSAGFYGSILAPNATIKLSGNSDYYGALLGATVDFKGNFSFHVDESLELLNVLKGPVVLVR